MVWTPVFEASQEEALIDNVLAIITRDFKVALDHRYPTEAALPATDPHHLLDFRERSLGMIVGATFPALAVGADRGVAGDGPNGECLRENIIAHLWIGVTDDSIPNVSRRIMRYRATMDAVLRAATIPDYFRNMSVDCFAFVLDEIEYTYGPLAGNRDKTEIFQSVNLRVPFKLNER